jgi:hypothetical protein
MKTRRPRFIRRGIYTAWAFVALASLLTTLLTPSAAPRATLTAVDAGASPTMSRTNGTQNTAWVAAAQTPTGTYAPWDDNELSEYIQRYRAWHYISEGRNVAAFKLNMPNGSSMIIVGASAGTQVKDEDRNVIFDVYNNGKLLQSVIRNNYLKGKWINGGNFDSEMLIVRYIKELNLHPASIDIVSELLFCVLCYSRISSTLRDVPTTLRYNFPEPSESISAIENNKTLSPSERLKEVQDIARSQKQSTLGKWNRAGRLINGKLPGISPENARKIDQQLIKIRSFVSDCNQSSPLSESGGNVDGPTELTAFSSSDPCGEGEGIPGGLVKTLTSGNLGGVDFSTLQMRYMSDDPDSTGLQYAFSGQKDNSATPQDIGSALNVLTDNAADLRTWLVLNPDEFWVNLNPSEPDRIIGSQLGETNAGRELLDADFQLKRSSATLMNPNTKLGAQYWRDLAGSSSSVCYGSRMWIVPGQVEVREDGGSLYILKAQLAVKAVPDHVADMPASCHYDAQTDARGQRLDQTMIVPLITKMVNTAPEYAPIRRAFMARIVAQWIRDRHASGQRTSFDSLIGSGNIGPARLQDGWQPQQVFNAYVKSLKDGEFTYNTTFHQGRATYIQKITIGGVDFTSLNPTTVSAAQMNQDYPQLAQTAKSSVSQLTSSDGSLWLGGTLAPPSGSTWSKVTDPVRSVASGRTGILILVLAGLGVVIFGIRRGSRRGRQAT